MIMYTEQHFKPVQIQRCFVVVFGYYFLAHITLA